MDQRGFPQLLPVPMSLSPTLQRHCVRRGRDTSWEGWSHASLLEATPWVIRQTRVPRVTWHSVGKGHSHRTAQRDRKC